MNERIRQLVEELRGAVSQALVDSLDVDHALRNIRREGWSLYLVVDRKRDGASLEAYEMAKDVEDEGEVVFRIGRTDLNFLRSIGIDPTRRTRRRRAES